jgi:hypothetical protein
LGIFHCQTGNINLGKRCGFTKLRSHQWQTISICPLLALNPHLFQNFSLTVWQWKMTKFLSVFVLYRRSCMLCTSFMQLTQICQVRKINKIINKWTVTNCGLMFEWYVNKSASRILENLGNVIGWPSSQFLLRRRWTN